MPEHENSLLIYNAALHAPPGAWTPGWLLVQGSRIGLIGAGEPPRFPDGQVGRSLDAGGRALLPGFIDLHVHGAVGQEVMDASPDGLRQMARYYASHGVTAFLATTWTAAREAILRALGAVRQVQGRIPGGATLLGAHLEGPYLNPQRCGAQDASLIRRAERGEALELLDSGVVRLLALAPEFEGNLWLIDECVRRGITVSAGHTSAGRDEMAEAVRRGLTQVTHCFNAMSGLGHRELGTVGAAMAFPQISCELIADNIHVDPAVMKILLQVKGSERIILVSDAIRGAGLPDGEYAIDERTVTIRDEQVRLPDGRLAGSVLTMERALGNLVSASGWSLQELWGTSSLNAARAIGESARRGSLEAGKLADLVLLDDDFSVKLTVVEGEIVFEG